MSSDEANGVGVSPPEGIACPGLFYAVPAHDGILLRIRTPGGLLTSTQSDIVAHFAERWGNGWVQITNRANLQIRAVRTIPTAPVFSALQAAGLAAANARVDHLRNIMASPTAGIDPQALTDTRALVTALDRTIALHDEFADLPAKFSVGFDGGEALSVRQHPNDIWLVAAPDPPLPGESHAVSFRLAFNGEQRQELVTDLWCRPEECVQLVVAIAHVYLEQLHGLARHTPGKKPRLRQVLAQQGVTRYLERVLRALPFAVQHRPHVAPSAAVPPQYRHLGVHPQRQPGLAYLGVVTPLGRLTAHQLRGLARLAQSYGSGTLRLTPWQNVLIPDLPKAHISAVQQAIAELGLAGSATHPWSALVACAGSTGCSTAATNTLQHASELASALTQGGLLDRPLNVHYSGCTKSCAQHYPSDIALLGTTVPQGATTVEGYHIYVGTEERPFGRLLYAAVPAAAVPALLVRLLQVYRERQLPGESFEAFTRRYTVAALRQVVHPSAISQVNIP